MKFGCLNIKLKPQGFFFFACFSPPPNLQFRVSLGFRFKLSNNVFVYLFLSNPSLRPVLSAGDFLYLSSKDKPWSSLLQFPFSTLGLLTFSFSTVATDSERHNARIARIRSRHGHAPEHAPSRGLPLNYRAPVPTCDGPGGRKRVKDLWVMTNQRPDLVFLHVHPVGKSGRMGEQEHKGEHKVQGRFRDIETNRWCSKEVHV